MSATSPLWNEVHDLFDTDDGSLPEVRVDFADAQAVVRGYALLRGVANATSPEDAALCRISDHAERPLGSVPNPAALVVAAEAHPFHVVLCGVQSRGVTLPDIGVFVFPDQLALDYRMGCAWGSAEVEAFFVVLAQLLALDPQASLSLEQGVLPDVVARFNAAWKRYATTNAA